MVFGPDARRIILAMLGKLPPRLRRVLVPFVSRYLRRRAMFFLSILSRRFGIVFVYNKKCPATVHLTVAPYVSRDTFKAFGPFIGPY